MLVVFGWLNIYSVGCEPVFSQYVFWPSSNAGKQFMWIITTLFVFFVSFCLEARVYQSLAYFFYAFAMVLLLCTLIWGVSIGGHRAWLPWGGQPSEVAKLACAMAIAKYVDGTHVQFTKLRPQLILLGIILLPVAIISLQSDVGSSLVFGAFVIVFYREGLSPWLLLAGIFIVTISVLTLLIPHVYLIVGTISLALILTGVVRRTSKKVVLVVLIALGTLVLIEGFHLCVEKVLKPHHQSRIKALVDPNADPLGIGWNVTQSKIAIGSGGLWGKGFLQGSQTKYGFVPEQSTDFIFCTIGEEYGWMGVLLVIGIFLGLMSRILYISERQRLRFARVYGYGIASILFFHFVINIGMTIGLMPVIGIPLPFISYGGSSLCSFSLMLFILLKFDAERKNYRSWRRTSSLDRLD
jgi:rod shape determining protein RodA